MTAAGVRRRLCYAVCLGTATTLACNSPVESSEDQATESSEGADEGAPETGDATGPEISWENNDEDEQNSDDDDQDSHDAGDPCKVLAGQLDAENPRPGDVAPPGSFDPDIQWTWSDTDSDAGSMVIPLVANLTDDDGDGDVDLCDIPDVVLTIADNNNYQGSLIVLSGDGSGEHFRIEGIAPHSTPALGDINGDGIADIIAISAQLTLSAWDHNGDHLWDSDALGSHGLGEMTLPSARALST